MSTSDSTTRFHFTEAEKAEVLSSAEQLLVSQSAPATNFKLTLVTLLVHYLLVPNEKRLHAKPKKALLADTVYLLNFLDAIGD